MIGSVVFVRHSVAPSRRWQCKWLSFDVLLLLCVSALQSSCTSAAWYCFVHHNLDAAVLQSCGIGESSEPRFRAVPARLYSCHSNSLIEVFGNRVFAANKLTQSPDKLWSMQHHVDAIRDMYKKDWESTDVQRQQMGCALYFIDQLALRAGHEKDEDEADTVGCCTLKVPHPLLHTSPPAKITATKLLTGARLPIIQALLDLPPYKKPWTFYHLSTNTLQFKTQKVSVFATLPTK